MFDGRRRRQVKLWRSQGFEQMVGPPFDKLTKAIQAQTIGTHSLEETAVFARMRPFLKEESLQFFPQFRRDPTQIAAAAPNDEAFAAGNEKGVRVEQLCGQRLSIIPDAGSGKSASTIFLTETALQIASLAYRHIPVERNRIEQCRREHT